MVDCPAMIPAQLVLIWYGYHLPVSLEILFPIHKKVGMRRILYTNPPYPNEQNVHKNTLQYDALRSSSRQLWGRGLPQCMLGYTPPGVGLETPPFRPLKLLTGCGPGNLQGMLGYTPLPGDLQGMLGYHLQGILGSPLWTDRHT